MGLLNYYGKFLPALATKLNPLNNLLKKQQQWKWTSECESAFNWAKQALTSAKVLVHYNPDLPIRVAADASAYGIGAVLSHVQQDGSERPVAYASRTLSSSEKNYSQIEKEALALIFAVKKFHQYIYGRHFTLVTDHKPLLTILGPKKGIPPLAAARMQRWSFLLSAYTYNILFKPTTLHGNADGLSRLPVQHHSTSKEEVPEIAEFNISQIALLPVSSAQVAKAIKTDPTLAKVLTYVKQGWPSSLPEEDPMIKPYWNHRSELTVEGECLMLGIRVVIPQKLQNSVLQELHNSHPGMQRMKSLARSHVWWPGLDRDIETMVKACTPCQQVKQAPAVAPLHPWIWPSRPWTRVHVDFAGPVFGSSFLIVVDAHSKWPEVQEMKSTTAAKTIEVLRQMFARYGLPEQLVSDNGPQFIAEEFATFLKQNAVKHIKCAPYHPSSNGLAERFVRTFKEAMRTGDRDNTPLHHRIESFLLTYRATPHATTGVSPCSLFLGRDIRTRLHVLTPSLDSTVADSQAGQKSQHDRRAKEREFHVGQEVMVRNLRPGPNYIPGTIVERQGPLSYLVSVQDGVTWRRHVDHLKELGPQSSGPRPPDSSAEPDIPAEEQDFLPPSLPMDTGATTGSSVTSPSSSAPPVSILPPPMSTPSATTTSRVYPSRSRHPPERYGRYVIH